MSSDARRALRRAVTPGRPLRRRGIGRAGPIGVVGSRVADGYRRQLGHDIVDVLRIGQDAAEVDDPLLDEAGDLGLTVFERSEQPTFHRIAAATEVGVGGPASMSLAGGASDRHRQGTGPRFVHGWQEEHGDTDDLGRDDRSVVLALTPRDLQTGRRRHTRQTHGFDGPVGSQHHADSHEATRCRHRLRHLSPRS